ncbi:hypothetical protein OMW55_01110 [Sphingomonas sp. BN140010]|uniref:Secreted protein n=1 Tax=Sphingomonas arvum TaxID=2992113 RepID=A0ABT3JBH2_9SPHN|nr:hypothetical protein [Sphingomonas sp. BN140010]MCW3796410.1 hypothetical protein [Sphingomonas sp. BN140010]
MRLPLLLIALSAATPAVAQPLPPSQLPPEIASGQVVDQLQPVLRAVAHAFLDLPVGEIQVAVENRAVRPEERNRRVRDLAGVDERQLDREIAEGSDTMKAGTQAIARSLPAISRALNQASDEIARTLNNLPSPTYPRR